MDAKQKRNSRPKLDRRNALKNVEYNASPTTSSSLHPSSSFHVAASADDDDNDDLLSVGGHRSRSLDLPPFFHNQKSFRIKGTDGEFDLICRSLGLSGIDDFSIPTADWEAHRSNSDLATRLRNNLASSTSAPAPSRLKPAQPEKLDEVRVRVGSVTAGPSQGIKGTRPPVLAPPPVAGRSVAYDYTSTWDLLKSFAPLEDEVVAPNPTRLGGYAETTSSSSPSSAASSEEEDKKQNEVPLESTSNRNENETENENEIENDIGIVRATNVIPVYSFSPRGKLRRSISSWQKGELLGSGSFGTVYEGYTEDGYFFAVKEVSLLDQGSQGKQNISYLEQEISLLKQFEHENIVQYLGTEKDESRIYIFLELVTKGSLASLYQKYRLRDSQVSAYTRQILNGLKYLHDKKVIHRDIKCSNILVDASGSVKLADFGLAKVTKLNDIKSCKGTPFWMAPEVVNLKNRFYGLAADIWSLGCTVLEMLTRQHPYSHLEGENSEWTDWHTNVLSKRNAVENVFQWACGRPTALQDRNRDSDDDDYQDRDYDVAALANNLSQAFRYGIYSNDDIDEAHGSLERDDEDVYFDDESAEVVLSSLRLGDDQESGSLFTNSNWFAFEDDRVANERSTGSHASPSPNTEETCVINGGSDDNVIVGEDDDLVDTATSSPEAGTKSEDTTHLDNSRETGHAETDKPPEWVEWRETMDSSDPTDVLPNGEIQVGLELSEADAAEASSSTDGLEKNDETAAGHLPESADANPSPDPSEQSESANENSSLDPTNSDDVAVAEGAEGKSMAEEEKKEVDEKSGLGPTDSDDVVAAEGMEVTSKAEEEKKDVDEKSGLGPTDSDDAVAAQAMEGTSTAEEKKDVDEKSSLGPTNSDDVVVAEGIEGTPKAEEDKKDDNEKSSLGPTDSDDVVVAVEKEGTPEGEEEKKDVKEAGN